jgi:plasmid stabilization system protein ParE
VTLPVVWLPEAEADFGDALAWYQRVRPSLGERFALAIEGAVERSKQKPSAFSRDLSQPAACRSSTLPSRNNFRGSGESDRGHRLFSRQARSTTLAIPLAISTSDRAIEH